MSEEIKSVDQEQSLSETIVRLEANKNQYYKGICYQLWTQPQIHADGKILGCCANYWGDFGSVFDYPSLFEAINNEKMRYGRRMLAGEAMERADIPCTNCHHFKAIKEMKNWVTVQEVSESL